LDLTTGVTRFTNRDARGRTLALTQAVTAKPGAEAVVGLKAFAQSAVGGGSPEVVLVWRDGAGGPVETELRATIGDSASGEVRLSGAVPEQAAQAVLRLELPPGAALSVVDVTLEQDPVTGVPVSFLSEAPGALTIRGFTVAYEPAPQPEPVTPEGGLCRPTPADRWPGDVCEADPCCSCGKPGETAPALQASLAFARPQTVVSFADRTIFALERHIVARLVDPTLDERVAISPERILEAARPVTLVAEVGEVRAEALATLGLTTPRLLALADPEVLVARLDFAPRLAERIVESARLVIGER
jgi:hypothetical protein